MKIFKFVFVLAVRVMLPFALVAVAFCAAKAWLEQQIGVSHEKL
jgi:hypothetical protein